MRWLALTLALMAAPLAAQQASTRPVIACPSVRTFDTQRQLARSGNAEAWAAFLEKAQCRRIRPSIRVRVDSLPGRNDVAGIATDVPTEDGGWRGLLYVDPRDLRRMPGA